MENRTQIILMVIAVGIIAVIIGYGYIREQPAPATGEGDLKQFASAAEVRAYLAAHVASGVSTWNRAVDAVVPQEVNGVAEKSSAPSLPNLGGTSGLGDYSATNVQVEGVDEADIVKNDGEYVYLISGGELIIVDAYPGEKAKILSETPMNGTPSEMFLSGNRLVIFAAGTAGPVVYKSSATGLAMPGYYQPGTHAYVYSVKNRAAPVLVRDIALPGNYYDARMIGDRVYAITNQYVSSYSDDIRMPLVEDNLGKTIEPTVSYFDQPFSSYVFSTITSFFITDDNSLSAEAYLLGYTSTLYVSEDNIYMAIQKPVAVPVEPVVRNDLAVSSVQRMPSMEVTGIYKFAIDNGRIKYVGAGEEIVIDPFDGGTIVSPHDCQRILDRISGGKLAFEPRFLSPVGTRQILTRMLTNLKMIYFNGQAYAKALGVVDRLLILEPRAASEVRDRGLLYCQLNRYREAMTDLERYLRLASEAEDAEVIRDHLRAIRQREVSMN